MERYRIGLMSGNKSIDYAHSIYMGVRNTLEEEGHVVVGIADLIPFHSKDNAASYFRVAFEVASRLELDAMIVPAGSVVGLISEESMGLDELLGVLDRRRTLVLERDIAGYRCITKDNAPGMHACMRHLIEVRGLRRIAFVGGPHTSLGARERERIYFEEMAAHGLPTPKSMLARGELSGECGDEIDRLIDQNPGLEAIVCCCDLIAHTVYGVLRGHGIAVGTDIAVTGFDDLVSSAHMDPPLSSVHLTGYDLGCMAAREACRLCAGLPQRERTLTSEFVVRESCGDGQDGAVGALQALLRARPLDTGRIVGLLMDHTLTMAPRAVREDFWQVMASFVDDVAAAWREHARAPRAGNELFATQRITALFEREYRAYLSPEGFQSQALWLLQALMREAGAHEAAWIVDQMANLHLGVARLLNTELDQLRVVTSVREWITFHITDDAVRESTNPEVAHELMLGELRRIGVRKADLYLLPEPVAFLGSRTFALSDTLLPIGHLSEGVARAAVGEASIRLQDMLDHALTHDAERGSWTVGGIMAGDELMGVAVLDVGTLNPDGQLMAFLNMGIALKHLQMIAMERETNEILSKNNVALERQSHYDEMTGALNRRGFMSRLGQLMQGSMGRTGALFYLDLDGLKEINDRFGHDSGDEAIRKAMEVLASCLSRDALLGRMGGDEFVAFVPVADEEGIAALGRAIDVGMAAFNRTHSYPFELSVSYGGVFVRIGEGTFATVNELMVQADERLYQMKKLRGSKRI